MGTINPFPGRCSRHGSSVVERRLQETEVMGSNPSCDDFFGDVSSNGKKRPRFQSSTGFSNAGSIPAACMFFQLAEPFLGTVQDRQFFQLRALLGRTFQYSPFFWLAENTFSRVSDIFHIFPKLTVQLPSNVQNERVAFSTTEIFRLTCAPSNEREESNITNRDFLFARTDIANHVF